MTYNTLDNSLWNSIDDAYATADNYLVVDEPRGGSFGERICAVYFSSNGLYFPKTLENFNREIIERNRFEWFGTRLHRASRHVFLRDLRMRWYQDGISSRLNTIDKLADFLREQTVGCKAVCVGSSAGGYAALLFSALLGADACFAFSPCLDVARSICLNRGLVGKSEYWDERYDRLLSLRGKYNDLTGLLLSSPSCARYVCIPVQSVIDRPEYSAMRGMPGMRFLCVNSAIHGVGFPKEVVARLLNLDDQTLSKFYDDSFCWDVLPLIWRLMPSRCLRSAIRLAVEDLEGRRYPFLRKRFYNRFFSILHGACKARKVVLR